MGILPLGPVDIFGKYGVVRWEADLGAGGIVTFSGRDSWAA